jgi:hypothetical protein
MLKQALQSFFLVGCIAGCGGEAAPNATTEQPEESAYELTLPKGSCGGTAYACTEFTETGCMRQQGCKTDYSSGSLSCSGTAKACTSLTSALKCEQQKGCRWSETINVEP